MKTVNMWITVLVIISALLLLAAIGINSLIWQLMVSFVGGGLLGAAFLVHKKRAELV